MNYIPGQTIEIRGTITNGDNALEDPMLVVCAIMLPSGVTQSLLVTREGLGKYRAAFVPVTPGTYRYRVSSAGGVTAATQGSLAVDPSFTVDTSV